MLMIRLQRTGRRNIPTYRLVVVEKSAPARGGKATEYLGHYLPARKPPVFEFEKERIEHWLKMGAHPSDTAARLLSRAGLKGLEKYIVHYTKKAKKGAQPFPPQEKEIKGTPSSGDKEQKGLDDKAKEA